MYETGGATNVADLLDKLRVFALAQGWAVDYSGPRGAGSAGSVALLLNKGGLFYGFSTDTSAGSADDPGAYLGCFQYPGPYVNTTDKGAQASKSVDTWANNLPGPFQAYHFFSGNNDAGQSYLHVVIEAQPGSFRHVGIGVINKVGAVNTGAYNYGSRWNYHQDWLQGLASAFHMVPWDSIGTRNAAGWDSTIVRCDSDALAPKYGHYNLNNINLADTLRIYGGFLNSVAASGIALGPSTLTGRSILIPAFGAIQRPSGFFSVIGGPADIRFVNIANLLPGELITLGPDSWRVFPIIRKNGAGGQESSGTWGYAYKVVP